jgi:hypothetical protein
LSCIVPYITYIIFLEYIGRIVARGATPFARDLP